MKTAFSWKRKIAPEEVARLEQLLSSQIRPIHIRPDFASELYDSLTTGPMIQHTSFGTNRKWIAGGLLGAAGIISGIYLISLGIQLLKKYGTFSYKI